MRKILKVKWLIIGLVLISLVFISCGTDEEQGAVASAGTTDLSNLKIGFSIQTLKSPYFVAMAEAFEKTCEDKGYELITIDAENDPVKQDADCEDLVARGVDVIVINPRDSKAAVQTSIKVMNAGIPLFAVDSTIADGGKFTGEITSANDEDGYLVGRWVAEQMGKTSLKIGMLSGNPGNAIGLIRRAGLIKGITEYQLEKYNSTNFEIVTQGWGGWDSPTGVDATEDMLTTAPDMNVLLAENDSMALGAMKVFQDSGRTDILIAAAADGQKEAYEAIMAGTYGATGLNDPILLAELTLEQIEKHLSGEQIIQSLVTKAACVTKENAKEFYNPNSAF